MAEPITTRELNTANPVEEKQDCGCGCGGESCGIASQDCGCGCGGESCGSGWQELVLVGSRATPDAKPGCGCGCDGSCGCGG